MSTGPAEPPEAVDDMVQVVKGFLEALREPNRRSEGIALSSIPWAVLKRYPFSPEELTVLLDWLDSEIEDGEALPPIFRCPIEEVHCKGSSWLHLAAERGSLSACEALLDAGMYLSQRDGQRRRACDRAGGWLASRLRPLRGVRGGSGSGLAMALASKEPIEEVTWWTLPVPPPVNLVGTKHSLLRMKLGDQLFLVESRPKVDIPCPDDDMTRRAALHGILVSKWQDVHSARHLKRLHRVATLRPSKPVHLSELLQYLVGLGDYDAAAHNCHHVAHEAYNFCASGAERLTELPLNRAHTAFAQGLWKFFGINLAPLRCCGMALDEKPAALLPAKLGVERKKWHWRTEKLWASDLSTASGQEAPAVWASGIYTW